MKRLIPLFIFLSLLLTGCGFWMNGSYSSVTPHTAHGAREEQETVPVTGYSDICTALEDMVRSGIESGILSAEGYDVGLLRDNMEQAARYIKTTFPLGAYAVEDISCEVGTTRGVPSVSVTVTYNHNRSVLSRIRQVSDMATAEVLVTTALNRCDSSLVMYVDNYAETDFVQIVRQYALSYPAQVMEIPHITVAHYPTSGVRRVIELQFSYQNSRENLLAMQDYVQPVFSSAALYVSGENDERMKFDMLYTFLLSRNTYREEHSVTPAYSLLRHGVGDSQAFASVYAAMCRRADLDSQVVSGTLDGSPWFWNIVRVNGSYYHVDILNSLSTNQIMTRTDDQMAGYEWNHAAYPACVAPESSNSDGTD